MSHVKRLKAKIRFLECLAKAAERCGLVLVIGQVEYKWFGKFMGDSPLPAGYTKEELGHCTHAIRNPNVNGSTYEIGVVPTKDPGEEGWELLFDEWRPQDILDERTAGPGCERLLQFYAVEVTKAQAEACGYTWEEQPTPDGNILVLVEV